MRSQEIPSVPEVTLINCDEEPVHTPGSIQPHGALLVLDQESFRILQASENTFSVLGREPEDLLNQPLKALLKEEHMQLLRAELPLHENTPKNAFLKNINPLRLSIEVEGENTDFNGIMHFSDNWLILELEPLLKDSDVAFTHFYDLSRKSLLALQSADELEDLYQVAIREVQSLTGFDRVLLYQFDDEWNGDVVAETRNKGVDSYLGLHFPHTDIPRQARALYTVNWLRYIPDATYQAVPIIAHKDNDFTLDLTHSTLRSVSPIHLEYLANMGVKATLTISLIKDNKLWGLIACHHSDTINLSYQTRIASEYIGQILSLQLALKQKSENQIMTLTLRRIHTLLIENITRKQDYQDSFIQLPEETLALTNATGVAICHEKHITLLGITPAYQEVTLLRNWVASQTNEQENMYYTARLARYYPPANKYTKKAAGLLAILIARPQQSYILWFRREVIQEVHWGGKPDKFYQKEENGTIRLHPRKSFDLWKETVKGASAKWNEEHVMMAQELGNAIKDIFAFKAAEYHRRNKTLSKLNNELKSEIKRRQEVQSALERSNAELERFAYVASHDLQEPLRAVSNFSMLLKKRYADKIDERADKYIRFIVDGTSRMQTLIDDILAYSRLERKGNHFVEIDTHKMIQEVKSNLSTAIQETDAKIKHQNLPTVVGDQSQLRQLFQNLIGNALKYRHHDVSPEIYVGYEEQEECWLFSVADNGIGIEKEFFDRIFVIFQRLHSAREYTGTGIGLAICQRISEMHQGKIWVESEFGEGSTFYFTISKHLKLSE
ncbi:ATP-binding protein [Tunicatimonas pelagia]|uniref:ATP-binding protein n=1 Tax=Tunicatimonas pelagia TaxID=931531 RepID=UPI002666D6E1|nr:ATP-binding protein [Tunicatimonas pelagia]WKN40416.1 ATP-binding protein [Tunicatimonas pelagia]